MCPFDHFTENYFNHYAPNNDISLVINFFVVFSRFEYALKETRFINGNEDGVSANWDLFASSIRESFQADRTPELRNSVDFLHFSPPRKQIIQDGNCLGWAPNRRGNNQPLIHELLLSIRTIRNNLFHGGKFQEVLHEGHARDRQLLHTSMIILEECLRLAPSVRTSFFPEIPDMLDAPSGENMYG